MKATKDRNQLNLFDPSSVSYVPTRSPQGTKLESPYLTPVFEVALRKVRDFAGGTMDRPSALARLFCDFLKDKDREHVVVAMLTTHHKVIGLNVVAVGTINAALFSPRYILLPGLLHNAAAVAVCHSHPSTSTEPSRADVESTRKLVAAGKALDLPVLDHIIVTPAGTWTSLAERGLM
jgi:DNA repair protein RadC